jgi:hypothetical protein
MALTITISKRGAWIIGSILTLWCYDAAEQSIHRYWHWKSFLLDVPAGIATGVILDNVEDIVYQDK